MIKFFRKIRYNLMEQSKTGKYFKYAIGEIILVVIGILIALSINNWNEGRKEVIKERQLLNNLQGEFKDNLQDLDSIAIEVNKVISSLEKVFDQFSQSNSDTPKDSLNNWLSTAMYSPNWKPSEFLLNSLNNSGTIAELKNEKLKLLLYKWSRQQKEMTEVQLRTEKTGEEIIGYLKEFGSLRNVDVTSQDFKYRPSNLVINNMSLMSDPRFENQIDDKLFMYKSTKLWLIRARKTIVQLIEETKN
jgi:capsule polysaccharide export protein KpsC/LpsZ